jgi:hypothetical protein
MDAEIGLENIFDNLDEALKRAREILGISNGKGAAPASNPIATPQVT